MVYVISLGIALLLTLAGGSLLTRSVSEVKVSEQTSRQAAAFQLADAGVDQAARNLRTPPPTVVDPAYGTNPNIASATTNVTLATGSFLIDPPTSIGTLTWRVKTHGTSASDTSHPRHIEVTFRLVPQSVFQYALFGAQTVSVSGSAITDSYDSRLGAYEACLSADPAVCSGHNPPLNEAHEGDIGTNATTAGGVNVSGSIFIDGQVAVGPEVPAPVSVVTGYDPAFITGGTYPPSDTQDVITQSEVFPMPDVTVPDGLTCADARINGGTTLTLSPTGGPLGTGVYCYRDLTVDGNATLTATGHVTIYLTGQLIAKGNSTVGVPADPRLMMFQMSSTSGATLEEGTITGSTEFYGGLYGPQATLNIQGNAEVYGSIIAKTVNVTGSAEVHYDQALTEVTDISNTFQTSLSSWRETEE